MLWEDPDWMPNTLADEGEESMLNVYLLEAANPSKYLGLLNDATIAETDDLGTMVESKVPAADGYNRQQIANTDWSAPALDSGDMQTAAAEETFGPASGSAWTCTHAMLVTHLTSQSAGSGKFLLYVALSATTTVAVGQSFKYTLSWKQQ